MGPEWRRADRAAIRARVHGGRVRNHGSDGGSLRPPRRGAAARLPFAGHRSRPAPIDRSHRRRAQRADASARRQRLQRSTRAACERAVAAVQRIDPAVRALRDVDNPMLLRARPLMDDTAYRRAGHVVPEIERPGKCGGTRRRPRNGGIVDVRVASIAARSVRGLVRRARSAGQPRFRPAWMSWRPPDGCGIWGQHRGARGRVVRRVVLDGDCRPLPS